MKTYYSFADFDQVKNAVVTIGTFDGVHIGHRKIIFRINEIARQINGESVLMTFFPHPRMVLHPEDNSIKLLNTLNERIELLEQAGIDHLLIIPFTAEFAETSSEDFIRQVLVEKLGTKKLVIGYDHHFGKNREGSFMNLKNSASDYGFEVEEIPEQDINDVAVSSTKIRKSLLLGDLSTAKQYLGYDFELNGTVVRGDQIGRTIGFPTANIFVGEKYKLIPKDGIYAAMANINGKQYAGMLYIGNRPTLNETKKVIELNIFDFDQDIYDQNIQVLLKEFIRDDQKFENLEALKAQLGNDEEVARRFFGL